MVGLLTGDQTAAGVPHVVGVRTDAGEDHAGGSGCRRRRSPFGAFNMVDGHRCADRPSKNAPIPGSCTTDVTSVRTTARCRWRSDPFCRTTAPCRVLTLPADNGTWGLGIVTSAKDKAMRSLKNLDVWTNVIKSMPLVAHWLDGEPLDDQVAVMAKIEDRHRTFVLDGHPVATGVVALADSWACTNPSVGRGISIGTIHAVGLRDLCHDMPGGPRRTAAAVARRDDRDGRAVVPEHARVRRAPTRLRSTRSSTIARFETTPEFEIGKALGVAARKDPEMLPRGSLDLVGVLGAARGGHGSARRVRTRRRAGQRLARRSAPGTEPR